MGEKLFYAERMKGHSWCRKYREHALPLSAGNRPGAAIARKSLMTGFIKDRVSGGENGIPGDAREYLEGKYREIPGLPHAQAAQMAQEDAQLVNRYLEGEKRTAACIPAGHGRVAAGGATVMVKPDLVFAGEGTPYVEAVVLACRKPDVTQTGKGTDTGAWQNLYLYSLLMWAGQYAREHGFPAGTSLKASFYFLKKKNDRSTGFADHDFFNNRGAGNVVSIGYSLGDTDPAIVKLEKLFREFVDGAGPDPARCGDCPYDGLCEAQEKPGCGEGDALQDSPGDPEGRPVSHAHRVPADRITLTGAQAEAVACREGTVRSNAGAGTGKTLMLAMRTTKMLMEGTDPSRICMLTFTKAAAEEMRGRVKQYLADFGCSAAADRLICTTFDSFWYGIVKEHHGLLGFAHAPALLEDRTERYMLLSGLMEQDPLPGLDYRNGAMRSEYYRGAYALAEDVIALIKRHPGAGKDCRALESLLEKEGLSRFIPPQVSMDGFIRLYGAWQGLLKQSCLVEYADLPLMVQELLGKVPGLLTRYGFRHVMVDEYQDTDPLQFSLISQLEDSTESFLVVGDDSQSIYGFRGSTPEHIIHFHEMMKRPGADYNLLENHRSSGNIVRFANAINARNINRVEKDLIPVRDDGCPVAVKAFGTRAEEYGYIAEEAGKLHAEGIPFPDMAFLAHNRSELLKMQETLAENGIPCGVTSPEPVMDDPGVRAAIALAKFARDPSDTESGYRAACMLRGHGMEDSAAAADIIWLDGEILRIKAMDRAARAGAFRELLEGAGTGNVFREFLDRAASGGSLSAMLDYLICFETYGENDTKRRDRECPGMELTTAHSSKGREWPVVFSSLSAYQKKGMDEGKTEEARRLVFVSVTRARDILYVTGQETAYGGKNGVPNMFLQECLESAGQE